MLLKKLGYTSYSQDIVVQKIDFFFLESVHKRHDIIPLKELYTKNVFVNDAAREVDLFLTACDDARQDTSNSDSEGFSNDDADDKDNA